MAVMKHGARSGVFGELGWADQINSEANTAQLGCRVALLGPGYEPNTTTDLTWAGIKDDEIAADSSYTSGGVPITSRTIQEDDAARTSWCNGGDAAFGNVNAGKTARWAAYIESTADGARVFRVVDLRPLNSGNDVVTDGGTLTLRHRDGHVVGLVWSAAA